MVVCRVLDLSHGVCAGYLTQAAQPLALGLGAGLPGGLPSIIIIKKMWGTFVLNEAVNPRKRKLTSSTGTKRVVCRVLDLSHGVCAGYLTTVVHLTFCTGCTGCLTSAVCRGQGPRTYPWGTGYLTSAVCRGQGLGNSTPPLQVLVCWVLDLLHSVHMVPDLCSVQGGQVPCTLWVCGQVKAKGQVPCTIWVYRVPDLLQCTGHLICPVVMTL